MTFSEQFLSEAKQIIDALDRAAIEGVVDLLAATREPRAGFSSWEWAAAPRMRRTPSTISAKSPASKPTRPPITSPN